MTAEAIVRRARELGITLTLKGDMIRYAPKSRAPDDFVDTLREHKPELYSHLRAQQVGRRGTGGMEDIPTPDQVREALAALRPRLSPSLRYLEDRKLLALVNWAVLVAWDKTRTELRGGA